MKRFTCSSNQGRREVTLAAINEKEAARKYLEREACGKGYYEVLCRPESGKPVLVGIHWSKQR